jgi:hypothetical protein
MAPARAATPRRHSDKVFVNVDAGRYTDSRLPAQGQCRYAPSNECNFSFKLVHVFLSFDQSLSDCEDDSAEGAAHWFPCHGDGLDHPAWWRGDGDNCPR